MKRNFQSSAVLCVLLVLLGSCNQEPSKFLPKNLVDELSTLERELMESPLDLDTAKAHQLAKKYFQAAQDFKLDSLSPMRLFKSAELFQAIPGRELEALNALSLIELHFPESEYASKALFISGLIYDNQLRNPAKAREKWNQFVTKYPKHPYTEQVLQLLAITDENPANDEEMVQKWLEQAQQNQ